MAARDDLTRWNRAGLSRFQYVDGNAPVFLEHLRAAMLAKFTRGLPPSDMARDPDFWFDLLRDGKEAPDATVIESYRTAMDWADLADGLAAVVEGKAARNARLVSNYNALSEDYAAETMRAFARAAHVLAGYTDAYMNEGYLATATQWDSLHKLGQMVNYAPVPAASASDTVALTVAEESGAVEIKAGLAMSAVPTSGGAPLIFETLSDIVTHPDLNEARERRWNVNRSVIDVSALNLWRLDVGTGPAPGAPVLLAPGKQTEPSAKALLVAQTRPGPDAQTLYIATQTKPSGKWRKGYAEMWHDPEGSAYGLITSRPGEEVVRIEKTANLKEGAVVQVRLAAGTIGSAVILDIVEDRVRLSSASDLRTIEAVRPMAEYPLTNGVMDLATDVDVAYFTYQGQVWTEPSTESYMVIGGSAALPGASTQSLVIYYDEGGATYRRVKVGATWGGIPDPDGDWIDAAYLRHPPAITAVLNNSDATIAFKGKAPKSLTEGSYYVARTKDDELVALRVRGYRADKDEYFVAFNKTPSEDPEKTLFFGPMKSVLRPDQHDRNMDPIVDDDGWITLAGLSDAAKDLIRRGRPVIIEDKRKIGPAPLLTTVDNVSDEARSSGTNGERDQVKIRFTSLVSKLSSFTAGWTVFRFNALSIGHGETKASKILGSGNGELNRQVLPLDIDNISFVADPVSATGVRPDIDVRVNEELWDYADLTDPLAEGSKSYSIRPQEDGTLQVVFRRRLPTGRNNARLSRHRVGTGSKGNGLGPFAFSKPKSKHKTVLGVFQPFATAGGADREDPDSIRTSAGASLAANDRAVSLADYARLVRRHASIWDARAVEVIQPGRAAAVDVTVVPVDGAPLNDDLSANLLSYLRARALPGTEVAISAFARVHVTLQATIRIDTAAYVAEDMTDLAARTLADTFALQKRALGQSLFVAEVLAALELIDGVQTAQASIDLKADTPDRKGLTFRSTTEAIRAVHPTRSEVAFVAALTDVSVTVEAV